LTRFKVATKIEVKKSGKKVTKKDIRKDKVGKANEKRRRNQVELKGELTQDKVNSLMRGEAEGLKQYKGKMRSSMKDETELKKRAPMTKKELTKDEPNQGRKAEVKKRETQKRTKQILRVFTDALDQGARLFDAILASECKVTLVNYECKPLDTWTIRFGTSNQRHLQLAHSSGVHATTVSVYKNELNNFILRGYLSNGDRFRLTIFLHGDLVLARLQRSRGLHPYGQGLVYSVLLAQ
jgi:hypothetical protein